MEGHYRTNRRVGHMKMTRTALKLMKRDDGFTLIEILVAVFVLAVSLLALVSVTVMVTKGNSLSQAMTTATTLAKDKLEELQNTAYGGISTGSDSITDSRNMIYNRNWTVTTGGSGNRKTIVMDVTFNWRGDDHTVTLNTIITD